MLTFTLVGAILFYIFGLIAILSVAAYVVYLVKYKHMIDVTRHIPSPPSWPILGHAQTFIGSPPHRTVRIIFEYAATYGHTFKLWYGMDLNIFLFEPHDVEYVMNSMRFLNKSHHYDFLKPWLKEGLLISRDKKWHQRRKALTPAFHFQILKPFVEVFHRQSRVFVDNLRRQCGEQTEYGFDLHKWLDLCTLDVICETAMGVSINAQTNIDSEYVRAIKTIAKVLQKRMFDLVYHLSFTYPFTKLAREDKKALRVLHNFTKNVILERREELLKAQQSGTKHTHETDTAHGMKGKMAFLDILLQCEIDGQPLSNADIREEVDTFMFEGHDTTSAAMLFCFYNLALYPECQRKCVAEIVEVIGKDTGKALTYEDLHKLHYVELCIKETLRLFPPVPVMGRVVEEDCEINGKTIPAGANLCFSHLVMGRREDIYPEASVFKPERFAGGNAAEAFNSFAYIPFSAGPRNCIGQKFAMLEIKTILANALRCYEFECVGDRDAKLLLETELVLRTKEPLRFKIKPRVLAE